MKSTVLRQERTSWPFVLTLSFLIIVQEIPYIVRQFSVGVYLPLILLLAIISFTWKIQIHNNNLLFAASILLYLTMAIGYKLAGISSAGIGHDIHTIMYFTLFLTVDGVLNMSRTQKLFTLRIAVLAMLFQMLSNTMSYIRLGSYYFSVYIDSENLGRSNISGTVYTCAVMLMAGISLLEILNGRKRKNNILWIIIFVICNLFNLLVMQRTIIFILSIIMYGLMIVYNSKHKIIVYFLLFLMGIIILIALKNFGIMVSWLSSFIHSERIIRRLNQISFAMARGNITRSTTRFDLIGVSLRTWTSSPKAFLIGVGDHITDNTVIGNHSQLFDVFAQYGLLGASLLYYSIYKSLKVLLKKLPIEEGRTYRHVVIICIIFVLRGLAGAILHEHNAVRLFVVLPIVISLLTENNGNVEYRSDSHAPHNIGRAEYDYAWTF